MGNERKEENTGVSAKHVSSKHGRAGPIPSPNSAGEHDEDTITDGILKKQGSGEGGNIGQVSVGRKRHQTEVRNMMEAQQSEDQNVISGMPPAR